MLINKGESKFMIIDVSPTELNHIFDAFSAGREYYTQLLHINDKDLEKAMGVEAKKIPEIKKALQEKLEFFEKHQKKILSYAK